MESIRADLTVVGGGIAGTCAALAAARLGLDVALVNDRPVLGGNSSSEVRVWVNGATGGNHNKYARESGIMEELLLRNKAHNPNGDADLWDAVLVDVVKAEPNCDLYLNTRITDVEFSDGRVNAVAGHQITTESELRFESSQFVDATGDGVVAAQTGAEFVVGREAADEYDEQAAPPVGSEETLGSSIMFYTKAEDHPVDYRPPEFARDFREDPPEIVAKRADPRQQRCCYWWIEYGGTEDLGVIADGEAIRDELWAIVYGVWDYMKNSGEFDDATENLTLEWVGKVPGKRESRRFVGEYVLREADLIEQRRFDDTVGHGGWPIDLHPPSGFYDDQGEGASQWHVPGPYAVPYRSLFTPDIENLLLAGRHVSASHVAFGSLRVQMSLATTGQAAGTAAALCEEHGTTVDGITEEYVDALQQTLLREDQWVIGEPNCDPADLARDATVTASSTQPPRLDDPDVSAAVESDLGLHLSADGHLDSVELLVEADADPDRPAELDVEVWSEDRPENYVPADHQSTTTLEVPAEQTWVDVPVDLDVSDSQGVFLILRANPDVEVHARERELTGVMALPSDDDETDPDSDIVREDTFWGRSAHHGRPPLDWVPCFRLHPETDLYAAENAVDGYARPFGLGHSWISELVDDGEPESEPWIDLSWDESHTVETVQLAFNTKLNLWYNIFGQEDQAEPETVRDYRVEAHTGDGWETVHRETDNYQRFRRHTFDPVETDRLRFVVEATNGVPWAEIFEIRAYGPDSTFPRTPR
jgi:ribulose 1,5-bisphosphate synthetase/thiazole synthase